MNTKTSEARQTCLKLEIGDAIIYVKGTWFESYFHLSISDGLNAWLCHGIFFFFDHFYVKSDFVIGKKSTATEEQVTERASQWDQPVSEYINFAERYLGFQHPGSIYRFTDAGDDHKRLSFTFEKEGTKLEWRWKCNPSPDQKKTTAEILDFLLDANIRLSEEVVRKTESFERLKEEADKCLSQSERFSTEKVEFEASVYSKFLAVLNSKKRKLRELRDQLSSKKSTRKLPQEEEEQEESTDKTESLDEGSDGDKTEEEPVEKVEGTSKSVPSTRGRGRKRITR